MVVDVQQQKPSVQIPILVGNVNQRKYVVVKRKKKDFHFVVSVDSYIYLPSCYRGGNLSRFYDSIVNTPTVVSSIEQLAQIIAEENKRRHHTDSIVYVRTEMPLEVDAMNGGKEMNVYKLEASYDTKTELKSIGVFVVGASGCPCAYETCGRTGVTHMQKSRVKVVLFYRKHDDIDAKDVVLSIRNCFSSPLYYSLKRDEECKLIKSIVNNCKFVEDICRDVCKTLKDKFGDVVVEAKVEVENDESIHPHKVVARWRGNLMEVVV